jgi:hypothetical protein
MAFDFNAAREIVEAAKKRGMIRAEGEQLPAARPEGKTGDARVTALPDWLQEGLSRPATPEPE